MNSIILLTLALNILLFLMGSQRLLSWRNLIGVLLLAVSAAFVPGALFSVMTFLLIYCVVSDTPDPCRDPGTSALYHGILGIQILANFAALISVWS
jgi:hypothetical protein